MLPAKIKTSGLLGLIFRHKLLERFLFESWRRPHRQLVQFSAVAPRRWNPQIFVPLGNRYRHQED
jgi:hypothetical protein